jgi:hypothetical protein
MADKPIDPKDIKEVNKELALVEDALLSISDLLKNKIQEAFTDIKDSSKSIAEIYASNFEKSIKKSAQNSDALLKNTLGILSGELKSKDISKQLNNLELQKLATTRSKLNLETALRDEGKLTVELQKEINEANEEAILQYTIQENILKEQQKEADKINSKVGVLGKILGGINKIPVIGQFINSEKALTKMNAVAAKEGTNTADVLKAGFSEVGASLTESLADPLILIPLLGKALYDAANKANQQVTTVGKSFGISYNEANKLRENYVQFSRTSGDVFVNVDRLLKAQTELSQQLGIAVNFSGQELAQFARLTEIVGLTAEEAGRLALASSETGQQLPEYIANLRKASFYAQQATGTHFSDKEILQDVSKLSAGILVKFQGSPTAIAKAVVQARALGTSLEQIDKIGNSLLDWQTSVENQLKAELITGRQLNLEKARYAALTGSQLDLEREIASQVGSAADFSNMNVIAQQSLAEAFGLSREELSEMLLKQEAIAKYGDKAKDLNAQQLKDLKDSGLSIDDYLKKQDEQRNAQESFNDAVQKLQSLLSGLVEGPVGQLLQGFATLIDHALVLYPIVGAIAGLIAGKMVMGIFDFGKGLLAALPKLATMVGLSSAKAVAEITAAEAISAGLATIGIIAGIAAAVGAMNSAKSESGQTKFATGGIVTSEINNATIGEAGPEAIIPLNSSKAAGMLGGGDISPLVAAINEVRNAVNALANKPQPAMALHVGAEKLGEVVGRQAETGTNQYKNAYRLA